MSQNSGEFLKTSGRRNPAFEEYCEIVGISKTEKDYFILLPTLDRQGPSSFIIERAYNEDASEIIQKIKHFLKETELTHTDFSNLLDIPRTTLMRLLNCTSTDKTLLRLIEIYLTDITLLRKLLPITAGKLSPLKLKSVQKYLSKNNTETNMNSKPTGTRGK